MIWKQLTLGAKILSSIATILALLAIIAGWSLFGVSRIVADGVEVTASNRLQGSVLQRELDHLNWVNSVSAFIHDPAVNEIGVELDHTRCGFGQWYYGDARAHAEELAPDLKPILTAVEEPHRLLHLSAWKISEVYQHANPELPGVLAAAVADHMAWSAKIAESIMLRERDISVEWNPKQCALGRFLSHGENRATLQTDPVLKHLLDAIEPQHVALHAAGRKARNALRQGNYKQAAKIYRQSVTPALEKTRNLLKQMRERAQSNLAGKVEAERIFTQETQPQLDLLKGHFHEMGSVIQKSLLSEQQMVTNAKQTRFVIILAVIAALIVGAFLAWLLSRAISQPVHEISTVLSASSTQISASATQQERVAAQQVTAVNEINVTLEELNASARQSSDQADASALSAQRALGRSHQGLTLVEESLEQMEEVMARMEAISAQITLLSERTGAIADISKLMVDFANETKMLAINASIEAVRAGEHGQGFTVLAMETRKLASESKQSAERISTLVNEIQQAASDAVSATDAGAQSIHGGMAVTRQTADAFQGVAESVQSAAESAQQISLNMRQQSTAIRQIVSAMSTIQVGAKESGDGISQVKTGLQNLNGIAQRLKRMV
ncbi:methyl-accepting chemotaxis protein [Magnetofaba australis]|uniref:Putative methyl-accepting chemotaxis sensory transducer n=1 Tax=Magnetofaba australis IT-1 TaxID=1434232 RepID=A0A1Y2KA50_9PROT|nr:methyl-accepting chemotaxis protein [Magnetofaba australis]OSM06241.1 putative methyl-accepting chemotaxis sensory transducer [Magnetofaba australis IT-1]